MTAFSAQFIPPSGVGHVTFSDRSFRSGKNKKNLSALAVQKIVLVRFKAVQKERKETMNAQIPVVILCGGLGTRLREETEFKPKPMVKIGNRPILWHIMKIYAHYGFRKFILCLGYKGDLIKEYFYHYEVMNNDVTITLGSNNGFKSKK